MLSPRTFRNAQEAAVMKDDAVRTYLDDHLGGAGFAIELLEQRSARTEEPWVADLQAAIEEDRDVLRTLAEQFASSSRPQEVATWLAEKAGRVKLWTDAHTHDALRDLLELEAIRTGIEGKRALWRSLEVLSIDARVAALDLDVLQQRAAEQAEVVERHRIKAVGRLR